MQVDLTCLTKEYIKNLSNIIVLKKDLQVTLCFYITLRHLLGSFAH